MAKVAILTDSSSCLTQEEAKQHGISVVPMPVIVNNVEYFDGVTITIDEFTSFMKQNANVKTSQPTVGSVIVLIDELLKTHEEVVFLPISSRLSGTYSTAKALEADYNGKLVVVDTNSVAQMLGDTAIMASELAKQGVSAEEIKNRVEAVREGTFGSVIPENLEHLRRGGRISPAAAALGSLLKIQPILKLENGAIDVYDKVRTLKKAYGVGIDAAIATVTNPDDYIFYILNANAQESAKEVASMLKEKLPTVDAKIVPLSSVIVCHTGLGTIAITRTKKL